MQMYTYVIGGVVMKLNGKAVVNVNNTGWSKFVDGNIFGKTDSTLYWNRDGTKPVTVIYNPCFGMTVNGPSQEQSLAVPKEGDKSESAPVSNVVAKVISNSPTEVSVKIEPGPMQVCFIRVPNAADEPGGKVNQTLFTNDVGGILRTNSNTGPIEAIEAAVSADINQIVKVSAAMQACPEKALSDAGVSEKEIKDIVARATMGGLLKQYANDKAKAQLISAAYNDYFTGARPNAITVELGQPLQRAAMYQQKLENTVNGLKGKLVKLEEQNAESQKQRMKEKQSNRDHEDYQKAPRDYDVDSW